jgi:dTDP-4-dehydrorhamnose reductase
MKILILGGTGLIGHKLWIELSRRFQDVFTIIHGKKKLFNKYGWYDTNKVIDYIDIMDFQKLEGIFYSVQPDVILNCIGITKRKKEINNPLLAISINSLFPHKLAQWAKLHNKRIIHFSTDCVFDGRIGNYTEESLTTAEDVYGRTKALGEINYSHTLTIRSSFIGRELFTQTELLEWFLSQKGKTIKGFTKAMYTGVSTIFMSKVVGEIIQYHPELSGVRQLSIENPISKYDLLCLARDAFKVNIEIIPDDTFEIRPTLNGSKLRGELGLSIPTWSEMMFEIASEKVYNIER